MKNIILMLLLLALSAVANAKTLHLESWYQNMACPDGEKTLSNRREVDCVTAEYAIEFDFAKKAYECAGQALYYSAKTGLKPGCVLIIENPVKDCHHLEIIQEINRAHPITIKLWTVGQPCSQVDNVFGVRL